MKTIEVNIYSFNELNKEAQQKAIDYERETRGDVAYWIKDDCGLLEPPDKILSDLLGGDYNFPLIKNNRELYFSLDRDRYIDISKAMEIQNNYHFLKWLGLDDELIEITDFKIGKDTIEFDTNDFSIEYSKGQEELLNTAREKFENHCEDILNRIEESWDYYYSDESIIEQITADECMYLETGEFYCV